MKIKKRYTKIVSTIFNISYMYGKYSGKGAHYFNIGTFYPLLNEFYFRKDKKYVKILRGLQYNFKIKIIKNLKARCQNLRIDNENYLYDDFVIDMISYDIIVSKDNKVKFETHS